MLLNRQGIYLRTSTLLTIIFISSNHRNGGGEDFKRRDYESLAIFWVTTSIDWLISIAMHGLGK